MVKTGVATAAGRAGQGRFQPAFTFYIRKNPGKIEQYASLGGPGMALSKPVFIAFPPRFESLEALNLGMLELGRLKCLEERVAAETEEKQRRIAEEARAALVVEIEGRKENEPLTVADWRAAIESAAEKFCDRNREALLEDGKKSRELVHGRFGWVDQKARLEPLEDFPAGGNPKLLEGMMKPLRAALQKLDDFFANAGRFVDLKLSWRKTELLKAWKDDDLTAAEIKRAGFAVVEPDEKFFIEPILGDVASQSAEKPK